MLELIEELIPVLDLGRLVRDPLNLLLALLMLLALHFPRALLYLFGVLLQSLRLLALLRDGRALGFASLPHAIPLCIPLPPDQLPLESAARHRLRPSPAPSCIGGTARCAALQISHERSQQALSPHGCAPSFSTSFTHIYRCGFG
ncbi:MAG: hypothetical protein ABI134_18795 [Byssovorax sp.]